MYTKGHLSEWLENFPELKSLDSEQLRYLDLLNPKEYPGIKTEMGVKHEVERLMKYELHGWIWIRRHPELVNEDEQIQIGLDYIKPEWFPLSEPSTEFLIEKARKEYKKAISEWEDELSQKVIEEDKALGIDYAENIKKDTIDGKLMVISFLGASAMLIDGIYCSIFGMKSIIYYILFALFSLIFILMIVFAKPRKTRPIIKELSQYKKENIKFSTTENFLMYTCVISFALLLILFIAGAVMEIFSTNIMATGDEFIYASGIFAVIFFLILLFGNNSKNISK